MYVNACKAYVCNLIPGEEAQRVTTFCAFGLSTWKICAYEPLRKSLVITVVKSVSNRGTKVNKFQILHFFCIVGPLKSIFTFSENFSFQFWKKGYALEYLLLNLLYLELIAAT